MNLSTEKIKIKKGATQGGILAYYRKVLKDKTRLYNKTSENIIWLKISKGVVSSTKWACIAGVYNSPKNSTYTKKDDFNALDILWQQLTKFLSSDLMVYRGRFQQYSWNWTRFCNWQWKWPSLFTRRMRIRRIHDSSRNNKDLSVNEYGQQLIDLCIA